MKIIAFLGNPGKQYHKNRHNIGFLCAEELANTYKISLSQKNFSSFSGTGKMDSQEVLFICPQTFMNSSGDSVQKALTYYRSDISDLAVVHDEIELGFGDIRIKKGGGHKGHNGIRSIAQKCGSPDFYRIRFGVGRPENPHIPVADYVLSNFSSTEMAEMPDLYVKVDELIQEFLGK